MGTADLRLSVRFTVHHKNIKATECTNISELNNKIHHSRKLGLILME